MKLYAMLFSIFYLVQGFQKRHSTRLYMSTSTLRTLPQVFFILGGPGAGKGTQCEKLSSEYGLLHVSAGDLLRSERSSGSSDGAMIEALITEGKIVPSGITIRLIEKAIIASQASRILIDGFPRNLENLETWNSLMQGRAHVESCIFIDCPEVELERRILSRGLSSGRSDDNLSSAKKRFATYTESTLPVIEHFRSQGKLIKIAGDQDVKAVWKDLQASFEKFIDFDQTKRLESQKFDNKE